MENRHKLFTEARILMKSSDPQKESILYHNIFNLKMSGNYLFSTKEDVIGLVNFLNSCEK